MARPMYAIDINTTFGTLPRGETDYHLATLRQVMDAMGIAAALTLSLRGAYADYITGNRETLATCTADQRLMPVATINSCQSLSRTADRAAPAQSSLSAQMSTLSFAAAARCAASSLMRSPPSVPGGCCTAPTRTCSTQSSCSAPTTTPASCRMWRSA